MMIRCLFLKRTARKIKTVVNSRFGRYVDKIGTLRHISLITVQFDASRQAYRSWQCGSLVARYLQKDHSPEKYLYEDLRAVYFVLSCQALSALCEQICDMIYDAGTYIEQCHLNCPFK